MNITGYIITLIVSFAVGYFVYDEVFESNAPKAKVFVEDVTVPGSSGNVTLNIDVRKVKPSEVPEKVRAQESIALQKQGGGMTLKLERGAIAHVKSFKDGILEVTDPSGKFSGTVPWEKTDFTRGVAMIRVKEEMGDPEAERRKKLESAELFRAEKARLAAAESAAEEEMADDEEEEEDEVTAEAGKETGPLTTEVSEDELLALMKDSVKNKLVSEFSVDGVTKWEAGDTETISDTEYQIGFATYEKETIFGNQPVVGKCLIRDGSVKKWVYAKTGADIP